jgi:hypothetical protein
MVKPVLFESSVADVRNKALDTAKELMIRHHRELHRELMIRHHREQRRGRPQKFIQSRNDFVSQSLRNGFSKGLRVAGLVHGKAAYVVCFPEEEKRVVLDRGAAQAGLFV